MSLQVNIEKNFKGFSLKTAFESTTSATGILGASGSGKSMTLRCVAGIETPDKGKIVINGRTVFDSEKKINLKPQERRIGYLFQNYALFPTMTVKDNIFCGYRGEGTKRRKSQRFYEKISVGGTGKPLSGTAFRWAAAASGTGPNDDWRTGSDSFG